MCVWTLFLNLDDGDSSLKGYCTQSILANYGSVVFSSSAGRGSAARIYELSNREGHLKQDGGCGTGTVCAVGRISFVGFPNK